MSQLFTPGLRISGRTKVVKRRDLPARGRVLVRVGERVQSETVVAEAEREGELYIVKVAEQLSLAPEEIANYLKVKQGDSVEEGSCVAELRGLWGLFRTTVVSPVAGTVELISKATGHVGIRAPQKRLTLSAYIDGTVVSVDEGRGVAIEADATFVQGIFGVGGERVGELRMLSVSYDTPLLESHIPDDTQGAVLVGGHSPSLEAVRKAARGGAVGLITGSIDDATLREYVGYDIGIALTGDELVPMTLIVTEGFGSIPMNPRIVDVLSAVSGSKASINGATQVRAGALRPEIICRPSEGVPGDDHNAVPGLRVGSLVRLIRVPYFGLHGVVTALPRELVQIETGAHARVAEVAIERNGGEVVVVPRANLEMA